MARRVQWLRPDRDSSWIVWVGCALALSAAWAGCDGGPHPLPPDGMGLNAPVVSLTGGTGSTSQGAPSTSDAQPVTPTMPGAATTPPALTPAKMPVMTPSAGVGSAAAAGAAAAVPGPPAAPAPATGTAAMGAAGTSGSAPTSGACSSQTFLAASSAAPAGVLFMVDRSAGMAMDYQGEPRWQLSGHALVGALTGLANRPLRVGALFYPSSVSNTQSCTGPAWLCPKPAGTGPTATQTCGVSALSADDQLEFQPATQALAQLNASSDLFASIAGEGVPLRESIERADAEMLGALLTGRSSVVLLVNAQPSCSWDETTSTATLSAWRTQRNIITHVIALPGADQAGMAKFAALARAGGTARVMAPGTAAALQSALQSVVTGSLDSCMLTLDPAVTDVANAHVIVGIAGVEQEIKRTADDGSAQWSISADGKQLMLLGKLCSSATGSVYDSLRVIVGCSQYPVAAP